MPSSNRTAAPAYAAAAQILRVLCVATVGLAAAAVPAAADTVTVGLLSFDQLVPGAPGSPGVNGFTLYNFTGSNSQPGTPGSSISFLDTTLAYDSGANVTALGEIDPGSIQPASLQFPVSEVITDALITGTLSTTSFTVAGQSYLASSDLFSADLLPSTPPDLQAGVDFVVIDIQATPVAAGVPEPQSILLLELGGVIFVAARRLRKTA